MLFKHAVDINNKQKRKQRTSFKFYSNFQFFCLESIPTLLYDFTRFYLSHFTSKLHIVVY